MMSAIIQSGYALRVQRENLGIKVKQVAHRLGFHTSYIYYLENLRSQTSWASRRYKEVLDEYESERAEELINKYPELVIEFLRQHLAR